MSTPNTHSEVKPTNIVLTLQKEGKAVYFDYKDGKWQLWGDMPIDDSAKLLFDSLGEQIEKRIDVYMKEKESELVKQVEGVEPSPNLERYLEIVKNGNMDDMYDYGVKLERECTLSIIRSKEQK